MPIPEVDWKYFQKLRPLLLDRFCQRVLAEAASLMADSTRTNHDRCLALYQLIRERDEDLAQMFDHHSRSSASLKIGIMNRCELLTAEEIAGFSAEMIKFLECLKPPTR